MKFKSVNAGYYLLNGVFAQLRRDMLPNIIDSE
jgi:hypothetical protein